MTRGRVLSACQSFRPGLFGSQAKDKVMYLTKNFQKSNNKDTRAQHPQYYPRENKEKKTKTKPKKTPSWGEKTQPVDFFLSNGGLAMLCLTYQTPASDALKTKAWPSVKCIRLWVQHKPRERPKAHHTKIEIYDQKFLK